jgi:hypothetical protein
MLLGHITDSAEVLHDPISAGRIGIRGAPAPVTNSSPFSAAGRSAAIPRGPPGLHK